SFLFFFFNVPPLTAISTLSLHDALPISSGGFASPPEGGGPARCYFLFAFRSYVPMSQRAPWGRRTPRSSVGGGQSERTASIAGRSEEHTSELQSPDHLVCRLLLEKKKQK